MMEHQPLATAGGTPDEAGAACSRCADPIASGSQFCSNCGTVEPTGLTGAGGGPGGMDAGAAETVDAAAAMARNTLFSLLTPADRAALLKLSFPRRYTPGAWLFREGRDTGRAFLVVSGTVHLLVGAGRGRHVIVRTLQAGDLCGAFTPEAGQSGLAAQALGTAEVRVFPRDAVDAAGAGSPIFRDAIRRYHEVQATEGFLRRASPFASLPPEVLTDLAAHLEPAAAAQGQVLFASGDPGDDMYLIRRGTLSIVIDEQQVATLRVGDCVGEAALITNQPRSATVTALEPVELLRLKREDFDRVVADHGEVQQFFVELLRRRDLLTPSVERAAGRATPRPTDAARAVERSLPAFAAARRWFMAVMGLSLLLLFLSMTSRGGTLAAPSQIFAVAGTLIAVFYIDRIPLVRSAGVPTKKLLVLELLGITLAVAHQAPFWHSLGFSPSTVFYLKTLMVPWATILIVLLFSARRGLPLQLDALVAGSALGLGYGVGSALVNWVIHGPVPASEFVITTWLGLVLRPGIAVAFMGVLAAGLWRARSQRNLTPLLAALGITLLSLALSELNALAPVPPVVASSALGLAALVAYWATPAYWLPALHSKAVALATFGMTGVLEQVNNAARVYCWGCGEPAAPEAVYCARCGQSLLSDNDEAPAETPAAA